jgi:hypothetical protein
VIFDFHTQFRTKCQTYKQRMRTDNVSDVTFSAPETSPRRHTTLTPPVRLVCAIGTYFLDCLVYWHSVDRWVSGYAAVVRCLFLHNSLNQVFPPLVFLHLLI